jgi:hypothetical protein
MDLRIRTNAVQEEEFRLRGGHGISGGHMGEAGAGRVPHDFGIKMADRKSHIEGVKAKCRTPAVIFQRDGPKHPVSSEKIIGSTRP